MKGTLSSNLERLTRMVLQLREVAGLLGLGWTLTEKVLIGFWGSVRDWAWGLQGFGKHYHQEGPYTVQLWN